MSNKFYFDGYEKDGKLVELLGRPLRRGDYFIASFNYSIYSNKTYSAIHTLPIYRIGENGKITALSVNNSVINEAQPMISHKNYLSYVYKIKVTDDIKTIMRGNKSIFNNDVDLKSVELLQREIKPGDLVLCNYGDFSYGFSKEKTFFGIVTGSNRVFNGETELSDVYKYFISNPEGKELKMQKLLQLKYNEYSINKINIMRKLFKNEELSNVEDLRNADYNLLQPNLYENSPDKQEWRRKKLYI